MRHACRQIEPLIARAPGELDAQSATALARHVAECADCRALDMIAGRLFEAARTPTTLGTAARERALQHAFAGAALPALVPARSRRGWNLPVALGTAAVAAAAVLVLGLGLDRHDGATAPAPLAQRAPIVAPRGPVAPDQAAPAAHASGEPLPAAHRVAEPVPTEPVWHEPAKPETRTFAHAQVALAGGSRVRFDAARTVLELSRGRVDVDVDAQAGARFTVATQHFRVEVLGTQFSVTPDAVVVRRGRVRVLGPDGGAELALLGAGETYTRRAGARTEARPKPAAAEHTSALLARARAALAAGDAAAARALLRQTEGLPATRAERAETGTLRAECALVVRDHGTAIRSYLEVARAFADLPAGENAAFAAAQLSARQPTPNEARTLFKRYLARYPQGRFADEARARLKAKP